MGGKKENEEDHTNRSRHKYIIIADINISLQQTKIYYYNIHDYIIEQIWKVGYADRRRTSKIQSDEQSYM